MATVRSCQHCYSHISCKPSPRSNWAANKPPSTHLEGVAGTLSLGVEGQTGSTLHGPEFVDMRNGRLCFHVFRGVRTGMKKGLRKRNSPMCTLSQNGYGENLRVWLQCPQLRTCASLQVANHEDQATHFGRLNCRFGRGREVPEDKHRLGRVSSRHARRGALCLTSAGFEPP